MKRKQTALVILIAATFFATACTPIARLTFIADPKVNDSQLVQVDIIATNTDDSKAILKIGPEDWFESEFKKTLTEEDLFTVALQPGETRQVQFKGPKGTDTYIIYAEIRGVVDRDAQQVVFKPSSGNKKLTIKVQDKQLVVLLKD